MPIGLLKDIIADLPKNTRLLGLDVGAKTIGVAMADPLLGVATPLETVKRTKFTQDIQLLAKIIREYDIGGYVIGLPVSMDGEEGRRAQSIRDFAAEMARHNDVFGANPWIALWDERLSTVSVEDAVDELVHKRKTKINSKTSGLIDKLAAQHILQGALEFINAPK